MSAGVAVHFKNRYGHQASLRAEGWAVGTVARRKVEDKYIFYLVTKPRYFQKPTYGSLWLTLVQLARWTELLGLRSMSIPPISCVRDRLDWGRVRDLIGEAFRGADITITVYH